MSESDLIRGCREGSREARRAIFDLYSDYAMGLAVHILMNRQDAEDCCQEAFFKAFRKIDRLDAGREFKPWFTAVLVRVCLDLRRQRIRFGRFLDRFKGEMRTGSVTGHVAPSAGREFDDSLLESLGPKERTALFLWAREGSTGREIGAALGCSEKTAYVHLYRARTKLRARLKETGYVPQ